VPDESKITGVFKGIADYLKNPPWLLELAMGGALGAAQGAAGGPVDTSDYWNARSRAHARTQLTDLARQHGLIGAKESLPEGTTSLADLKQLAPEYAPVGNQLLKLPGIFGGGPEVAEVPGLHIAEKHGRTLASPGTPAMQQNPDGSWGYILTPEGTPYTPPFRPQRPPSLPPGMSPTDPKDIAHAIMDGIQPPVLTGLYRFSAPVRAELARERYDLTTAQRDWQAIQKHIATLNGPQQERLRQAVTFTYDSLDVIDDLFNQWTKLGGAGGYRMLNKANLIASKQHPGELGTVATALEAQINDLTSELGTVYKGGLASTNETLRLAAKNLQANYTEPQFKKSLDLIRTNLRLRRNSILQSQPVGVSEGSPLLGAPPAALQAPTAPPASYQTPPGWTVEPVQ